MANNAYIQVEPLTIYQRSSEFENQNATSLHYFLVDLHIIICYSLSNKMFSNFLFMCKIELSDDPSIAQHSGYVFLVELQY